MRLPQALVTVAALLSALFRACAAAGCAPGQIGSCECEHGKMLAHNLGWESGDNKIQCVDADFGCNHIYDFKFKRCWQFVQRSANWWTAKDSCETPGVLASFHHQEERTFVHALLESHNATDGLYWMGSYIPMDGEERRWEHLDGSKRTPAAVEWGEQKSGVECVALKSNQNSVADYSTECFLEAIINGSICASPPQHCPAGQHGYFPECSACPSNGSSTPGFNFDVYSCQCPTGTALVYDNEACPVEGGITCKSTAGMTSCEGGIVDFQTSRCYKYIPHGVDGADFSNWQSAEDACDAWNGGHAASLHESRDFFLADRVWKAFGNVGRDLMWIGLRRDGGHHWVDGFPPVYVPNFAYTAVGGTPGACVGLSMTSETQRYLQAVGTKCEAEFAVEGKPRGIVGALCTKDGEWEAIPSVYHLELEPCPAGTYGEDVNSGCAECPMQGTSEEGVNTGVLSCKCPQGYALSLLWDENDGRNECVNASALGGCEDVYDFKHRRCLTYLDGMRDWFEAEAACQGWMSEGHLASYQDRLELREVISPLIHHHGPGRRCEYQDWVWIGTHAQVRRKQYQNPDRTKRTRAASTFGSGNYWGLALWSKFCLTVRTTHLDQVIPTECDPPEWNGAPTVEAKHMMGSVCATRPAECPAGQYGYFPECQPCPGGGSSTAGLNYGIFSCRCPEGQALSRNKPDADGIACSVPGPIARGRRALAVCDGVYDWQTARCWKYVAHIVSDVLVSSWEEIGANVSTWHQAEAACEEWGGHLASMHGVTELDLVRDMMLSMGNWGQDLVWFGHNRLSGELAWADGSDFTFSPWASNVLVSNSGQCGGTNWDEETSNSPMTRPSIRSFDCENPGEYVRGAICATTPDWACPAGTYGRKADAVLLEDSSPCKPCPAGSTSVKGLNVGVRSCSCHSGYALDSVSLECTPVEHCDGLYVSDLAQCWKYDDLRNASVGWHDAEERCKQWGGHLASFHLDPQNRDIDVARAIYYDAGNFLWDTVYIGLHWHAFSAGWRYSDGTPANTVHWDGGYGQPTSYPPGKHCGVARGRLRQTTFLSFANAFCSDPAVGGLCKKQVPCPAGYYGNGKDCRQCPQGSTSVAGSNTGAHACACANGSALVFDWWEDGVERLECVAVSGCEGGVVDPHTKTCWKLFGDVVDGEEAGPRCASWGGHLPEMTDGTVPAIADRIYTDNGLAGLDALWVVDRTKAGCVAVRRLGTKWKAPSNRGWVELFESACADTADVVGYLCEKQLGEAFMENKSFVNVQTLEPACMGCSFKLMEVDGRNTLFSSGVCAYFCFALDLSHNKIEAISDSALAMLGPQLHGLDLSSNALTSIHNSPFLHLYRLLLLDLSFNELSDSGVDAFVGMPNLQEMDLRYNSIYVLRAGVLDPLVSMHTLYLAGNPFSCSILVPATLQTLPGIDVEAFFALPKCRIPSQCRRPARSAFRGNTSEAVGLSAAAITHVQTATHAVTAIIPLLRPDAGAHLDRWHLQQNLYVVGAAGERCWCVEWELCFQIPVDTPYEACSTAGTFWSPQAAACVPCPPNSFAALPYVDSCQPCAAGSFAHAGATSCVECADGEYLPEGLQECRDRDECAEELSDCDADAFCSNLPNSYTCTCFDGFEGDGRAGGSGCAPCPPGYSCAVGVKSDLDECSLRTHDCHAEATCANEEGLYSCACNFGFEGNGFACFPEGNEGDTHGDGDQESEEPCAEVDSSICHHLGTCRRGFVAVQDVPTGSGIVVPEVEIPSDSDGRFRCGCFPDLLGHGYGPNGCETQGYAVRVLYRKKAALSAGEVASLLSLMGLPSAGCVPGALTGCDHVLETAHGADLGVNVLFRNTPHGAAAAAASAEAFNDAVSRRRAYPSEVDPEVGARVYSWKGGTTGSPIAIPPSGLEVQSVHFEPNCAATGCWVLSVIYTTGSSDVKLETFNTFYLPYAVGSDDLSFDFPYEANGIQDTFLASNFPCRVNKYRESTAVTTKAPVSATGCCFGTAFNASDTTLGGDSGGHGLLGRYRTTQAFADYAVLAYSELCPGGSENHSIDDHRGAGTTPKPEDRFPDGERAGPHTASSFLAEGQRFVGLPQSPGVTETRAQDAFIGQYRAVITLDERELRTSAGLLSGTVGVEHTVDFFLGFATFKPAATTWVLDSMATQTAIHVEKTSFFTASMHGVNDYTFLEYINLRLVAVYDEDAELSASDETTDRTLRTNSSGAAHYVQVTFTLGSRYGVNSNSDLIPIDSVRAGRGTFFDATEADGAMHHKCLEYTRAPANEFDSRATIARFNNILQQTCGPGAVVCASPSAIPDSFVAYNIPLGIDFFDVDSFAVDNNVFVDLVISVVDSEAREVDNTVPTNGEAPWQMKTTLSASIPVVDGGVNFFCDGFISKTDLKDVANVDLIVGTAESLLELTRLRIVENVASTELNQQAAVQVNTDSIEAGLMTLVINGNASYFNSASLNTRGVSLVLEDVVTIHLMGGSGSTFDGPGSQGKQQRVKDLLAESAADNSDAAGLGPDDYPLNGAFFFTIDRAAQRAHLEPSQQLLEVCPLNPPRPATTGAAVAEACVTRRDVRYRDYPWRVGAVSTAMEISHTALQAPLSASSSEARFLATILGDSAYTNQLASGFAAAINTRYALDGRFRRAFWVNPGYEWAPTQTGAASLFQLSQKLFLVALVTLDEQLASVPGASIFDANPAPEDSHGDGALSPNFPRTRRAGTARRLVVALEDQGAALSASELSFGSSPRSILAKAYGVPLDQVASFRVEAALPAELACAGRSDVSAALRAGFETHLWSMGGVVPALEILAVEVDREDVACRRRAGGQLGGSAAARAVVDMLLVYPIEAAAPHFDMTAFARLPNVMSVEALSVPAHFAVGPVGPDHVLPATLPNQPKEATPLDSESMNIPLVAGACAGGAAGFIALVYVSWRFHRPSNDSVAGVEPAVDVDALKLEATASDSHQRWQLGSDIVLLSMQSESSPCTRAEGGETAIF